MPGEINVGHVEGVRNTSMVPMEGRLNGSEDPLNLQWLHGRLNKGELRSQPFLGGLPLAMKASDTAGPASVFTALAMGLSKVSSLAAPAATIGAGLSVIPECGSNIIDLLEATKTDRDQEAADPRPLHSSPAVRSSEGTSSSEMTDVKERISETRNYIRSKQIQRPRNRLFRNLLDMARMLFSGATGIALIIVPASVAAIILASVVAPFVGGVIAMGLCIGQAWGTYKLSQRREEVLNKIQENSPDKLFNKPAEVELGKIIDKWLIKTRNQKIGGKEILTSIYGIAGGLGIAGGILGVLSFVGVISVASVATGGLVLAAMTAVFLGALAVWGGRCLYQWIQNYRAEKKLRMEWDAACRTLSVAGQARTELDERHAQEMRDPILPDSVGPMPFDRLDLAEKIWAAEDAERIYRDLHQRILQLDPDEAAKQFLFQCFGLPGNDAPAPPEGSATLEKYLEYRCESSCARFVGGSVSSMWDQWKSGNTERGVKTFREMLKF